MFPTQGITMRKLFSVLTVLLVSLGLTLAAGEASAAKFGGGKSFGKSFRTAPSQPQTSPLASKPTTTAAKPAAGKSGLMGGLLGGLLAGGLFAALLGSGAFEGLQIMDMVLMAGLAFLIFKLFRAFSQAKAGSMARQPAYATGPLQRESTPEQTPFGGSTAAQPAFGAATSGFADVPFDLPPGFELQAFLNGARDHYRTLQQAWNDNDLPKMREYVSPELYQALEQERARHPGAQHTEVMFVDAELVRAEHDANQAQISVRFNGRYRDTTEQVEADIREVWHLERDLRQGNSPWYIVGIEEA